MRHEMEEVEHRCLRAETLSLASSGNFYLPMEITALTSCVLTIWVLILARKMPSANA